MDILRPFTLNKISRTEPEQTPTYESSNDKA